MLELCQIQNGDIQRLVAESGARMTHYHRYDYRSVRIVMNSGWPIMYVLIAGILMDANMLLKRQQSNTE